MTTTQTTATAPRHDATSDANNFPCTQCGHLRTGQVPGCTCPGCDDTAPAALVDATALPLIDRIEEPSGASVRMWAGVLEAPIYWGAYFRA